MALLKCPECAREISDLAESCPQCGFPVANFIKKQKLQRIEQKTIKSEKIIYNEQLKQDNYQKWLELNGSQVENNSMLVPNDEFSGKPNYTFILGIIVVIILSGLAWVFYTAHTERYAIEDQHTKAVVQSRNWFNSAKTLIKSNKLLDSELGNAKASLESVDASMVEYKEAQELLHAVIKRISAIEKANTDKAAKEAKKLSIKKSKEKEVAINADINIWDRSMAITMAKQILEQKLKSPASAEYQPPIDMTVQKTNKGNWEVFGWVDAQNSFGAKLRNNFYLKMKQEGDRWIPIKVSMY